MTAGGPPENLMIPYLLGELSEQDQTSFERTCLDDDQLFEELLAVEAELTDDYVRGDLVGPRRAAFEKRLLNSPEGAKRVELAQLITHSGRSQTKSPSARTVSTKPHLKWWRSGWLSTPAQFAPLGAAAILVIGISLELLLWRKQPAQLSGNVAQAPQEQSAGQKPAMSASAEQQVARSAPPPVIATFVITGGGERDAGSVNEIKVPAGTDRVRLQVDLSATPYASYRASLKKVGARETDSLADLHASPSAAGKRLTIEVPADAVPAGDSILTVTGVRDNRASPEVIGQYFVRRVQ